MLQPVKLLICLFFLLLPGIKSAFAAPAHSLKVAPQIIVKGNERIEAEIIKSYIDTYDLSTEGLNLALKRLYQSDLFAEVKISEEGAGVIVVTVKENPIVSEISFKGNKKIDSQIFLDELKLKKRSPYTKDKLQFDIKKINDIYLKSGRFLSQINPKIITQEENRVEIIFEVYEGPKATIKGIDFFGNKAFSSQELLAEIETQKSKWYRFFGRGDTYDSDRLEIDKEKLRKFYSSQGYADFAVVSAIAELTPAKDKIFVNFLIEEGDKYNFGEINITNKVDNFDKSKLNKAVYTVKGKLFNQDLIDKTVERMTDILSENGYAFAIVEPTLKRDKERQIVEVDYLISPTARVYINKIHIRGNIRTFDEVIRRELRIKEGDAYNIVKINRSYQRIINLGFFEKVEIKSVRVGDSNQVDLEIEVKEKKTGELNFGIGYSTVDGLTGDVGIKENNLLGTGQELALDLQKSTRRFNSKISYTVPYFTGRDIAAGIDLVDYKIDKQNTLVYDQRADGVTLRGDYSLTEYLKQQLRYSYRHEVISNVNSDASVIIQSLSGGFVNSGMGHTLLYDKRDNRFDPKNGYYLTLSQDYAGIGGSKNYLRNEGSATYYLPLTNNNNLVLKFAGRFGYIEGIGQDIKSNDNFLLGGNNFRGFEYAGLGPRTAVNGNAVGGNAVGGKLYYTATAELRFPSGLPKELGVTTALFSDIGTLKLVDQFNKTSTEIIDSGLIRVSYGLSVIWTSPLGPIRFDFSQIARKEAFDLTQRFRFGFETSF